MKQIVIVEDKKGYLTKIVKSSVHPDFDIAYVDLKGAKGWYWKACLLSELIHLK